MIRVTQRGEERDVCRRIQGQSGGRDDSNSCSVPQPDQRYGCVIVLMEAPATEETYIDLLLAEPLRIPDFEPMHRDETHARG